MHSEIAEAAMQVPSGPTTPEAFAASRMGGAENFLNTLGNGATEIAKAAPSLLPMLHIGVIAGITGYALYMIVTGKNPLSQKN